MRQGKKFPSEHKILLTVPGAHLSGRLGSGGTRQCFCLYSHTSATVSQATLSGQSTAPQKEQENRCAKEFSELHFFSHMPQNYWDSIFCSYDRNTE